METIVKKVRSYTKGEDKAMVCINDEIHVSLKQVQALGYQTPQSLLGNKITVEYYKTGDKLLNDKECTKDNTIIKSFEVEASSKDIDMAKAANAGFKIFALS